MHGLSLAVLLIAIASSAAGAGDPSHPCAAVDDATERLACYDRAFPRPAEAAAAAASEAAHVVQQAPGRAVERAPEPKAAAATETAEEFGLSLTQLQARDPERVSTRIERIEATVTEVGYRPSGERVITLDNGQVWLQTEVTVRGPLRAGDAVAIRRAALGSFQLVTPGRVALRVRRIE
ncbi:MAG: type VI secretion system-associated protein TagO [Gammaproteobacteria bacterium]